MDGAADLTNVDKADEAEAEGTGPEEAAEGKPEEVQEEEEEEEEQQEDSETSDAPDFDALKGGEEDSKEGASEVAASAAKKKNKKPKTKKKVKAKNTQKNLAKIAGEMVDEVFSETRYDKLYTNATGQVQEIEKREQAQKAAEAAEKARLDALAAEEEDKRLAEEKAAQENASESLSESDLAFEDSFSSDEEATEKADIGDLNNIGKDALDMMSNVALREKAAKIQDEKRKKDIERLLKKREKAERKKERQERKLEKAEKRAAKEAKKAAKEAKKAKKEAKEAKKAKKAGRKKSKDKGQKSSKSKASRGKTPGKKKKRGKTPADGSKPKKVPQEGKVITGAQKMASAKKAQRKNKSTRRSLSRAGTAVGGSDLSDFDGDSDYSDSDFSERYSRPPTSKLREGVPRLHLDNLGEKAKKQREGVGEGPQAFEMPSDSGDEEEEEKFESKEDKQEYEHYERDHAEVNQIMALISNQPEEWGVNADQVREGEEVLAAQARKAQETKLKLQRRRDADEEGSKLLGETPTPTPTPDMPLMTPKSRALNSLEKKLFQQQEKLAKKLVEEGDLKSDVVEELAKAKPARRKSVVIVSSSKVKEKSGFDAIPEGNEEEAIAIAKKAKKKNTDRYITSRSNASSRSVTARDLARRAMMKRRGEISERDDREVDKDELEIEFDESEMPQPLVAQLELKSLQEWSALPGEKVALPRSDNIANDFLLLVGGGEDLGMVDLTSANDKLQAAAQPSQEDSTIVRMLLSSTSPTKASGAADAPPRSPGRQSPSVNIYDKRVPGNNSEPETKLPKTQIVYELDEKPSWNLTQVNYISPLANIVPLSQKPLEPSKEAAKTDEESEEESGADTAPGFHESKELKELKEAVDQQVREDINFTEKTETTTPSADKPKPVLAIDTGDKEEPSLSPEKLPETKSPQKPPQKSPQQSPQKSPGKELPAVEEKVAEEEELKETKESITNKLSELVLEAEATANALNGTLPLSLQDQQVERIQQILSGDIDSLTKSNIPLGILFTPGALQAASQNHIMLRKLKKYKEQMRKIYQDEEAAEIARAIRLERNKKDVFVPAQPQQQHQDNEVLAPISKRRGGPAFSMESQRAAKASRKNAMRRQKQSPVHFPGGGVLPLQSSPGVLPKRPINLDGDTSAGLRRLREISLQSQAELSNFKEHYGAKSTFVKGKAARIHRVDPLDRFLNVRLQLPPTTHAQADAQVKLRKKLDYAALADDLTDRSTGRSTGRSTSRSGILSSRFSARSTPRAVSPAEERLDKHERNMTLVTDKMRHHDLMEDDQMLSAREPPPAPIVKLGFGLKPLVGGNSFKRQPFLAYQESSVKIVNQHDKEAFKRPMALMLAIKTQTVNSKSPYQPSGKKKKIKRNKKRKDGEDNDEDEEKQGENKSNHKSSSRRSKQGMRYSISKYSRKTGAAQDEEEEAEDPDPGLATGWASSEIH